jgi:hypothetical protein
MITIAHVLVGGAVGLATGNPVAALVAGTASHFVLDMVPHLDVHPEAPRDEEDNIIFTPALYIQAFADVLIAAVIVCVFWVTYFDFPAITPFVIGAFGGFLPDLIDNVPFWKYQFRRLPGGMALHNFHEWTHDIWHARFPMTKYWWLGTLTQVITVGLCWSFLTNF